MHVEIRHEPAFRLAAIRHIGPYPEIGGAFDRLFAWAARSGLAPAEPIAIYHDDPGAVPADRLRSDAGIVVPADFAVEDPEVHVVDVPAQRCAVARHVGPYEKLPEAWSWFMGGWFPQSGQEIGDGLCYERYLNDPSDTPAERLVTELVEPLRG